MKGLLCVPYPFHFFIILRNFHTKITTKRIAPVIISDRALLILVEKTSEIPKVSGRFVGMMNIVVVVILRGVVVTIVDDIGVVDVVVEVVGIVILPPPPPLDGAVVVVVELPNKPHTLKCVVLARTKLSVVFTS